MDTTQNKAFGGLSGETKGKPEAVKVKYCLYARKSTESEEQQVLSIDSQIKEMLNMAERDHLEVVEIEKRELLTCLRSKITMANKQIKIM